jgi:hypothetical protein
MIKVENKALERAESDKAYEEYEAAYEDGEE